MKCRMKGCPNFGKRLTTLEQISGEAVRHSLIRNRNDKRAAAKELNVALKTVYNWINRIKAKDSE